ncbi:HEAT repeat domain-containing protein [bacterium]|nr:HEAT repeat domain-containing protein [bacterium]
MQPARAPKNFAPRLTTYIMSLVELGSRDIIHFLVFVAVLLTYYRSRSNPKNKQQIPSPRPLPAWSSPSRHSIETAAKRAHENDLEFLEQCLQHPDDEISLYASEQLSHIKNPRALQILMDQIQTLDQELSEAKSCAEIPQPSSRVEKYKEPEQQESLDTLVHPRLLDHSLKNLKPAYEPLPKNPTGEQIRDALWALILTELTPEMDRYYALKSFTFHPVAPSIERLQRILRDSSRWVVLGGLEITAHFEIREVVLLIEPHLRSKDPALVIEAIYALVTLGARSSRSRIRPLLSHSSRLVKEAASYALEKLSNSIRSET